MRRFGLVGRNIGYSFSRGHFSEKFEVLGLHDHVYENFDLADISEFPGLLKKHPDLVGLNVTIPYKEAVIPFLSALDPEARLIGAVNTICLGPEGPTGYNTDVIGFRESLRPLLLPADRQALILGTGGASKAVARALETLGIAYRYVSRRPAAGQLSYGELSAELLQRTPLLIQCTPLGTFPDTGRAPELPYEALGPSHLLYDLIYNPSLTTFLSHGQDRGARIKNGLEMLQIQAERAWELWNR